MFKLHLGRFEGIRSGLLPPPLAPLAPLLLLSLLRLLLSLSLHTTIPVVAPLLRFSSFGLILSLSLDEKPRPFIPMHVSHGICLRGVPLVFSSCSGRFLFQELGVLSLKLRLLEQLALVRFVQRRRRGRAGRGLETVNFTARALRRYHRSYLRSTAVLRSLCLLSQAACVTLSS